MFSLIRQLFSSLWRESSDVDLDVIVTGDQMKLTFKLEQN